MSVNFDSDINSLAEMKEFTAEDMEKDERAKLRVLGDLLLHSGIGLPINMQAYRAKHTKSWDVLGRLEHQGYLRRDHRDNRTYFVTLTGIARLNNKPARKFKRFAEKIYTELKKRYKNSQGGRVFLAELADKFELSIDEVRQTVRCMTEVHITDAHNIGFENLTEPEFLIPSENVINKKYKKFADYSREIERYRYHSPAMVRHLSAVDMVAEVTPVPPKRKEHVSGSLRIPEWYALLKPEIRGLLEEIHRAISIRANSLVAMGLRTIIDMVCADVVEDIGGFGEKLKKLEKQGHITSTQQTILLNALELGHAAAHRGHTPNSDDNKTLLDIVEHLLKQLYVHGPAAEKLRNNVPPRPRH